MKVQKSYFKTEIYAYALIQSLKKFNPMIQARNPVMFVVYIGSILTTFLAIYSANGHDMGGSTSFIAYIAIWLWLTLLFANFAESIAEQKSQAQADSLKNAKKLF